MTLQFENSRLKVVLMDTVDASESYLPQTIIAMAKRFARDEQGTTSIEYGLIASLMAVAIIASLKQLGNNTSGSWGSTANKVSNAME